MALKRALTVDNILDKVYDLIEWTGEWYDAFLQPETTGIWFIWGNSGNGKTSFILQLIKVLSGFFKILFNSREEGTTHTLRKSFEDFHMKDAHGKLLVVNESIEDLKVRLRMKKSPHVVIIDSFQYMQMSYRDYLAFKEEFGQKKLIIFISHADGKMPAGRSAKSVMYDAKLKIYTEGYRAFSKGRYIGSVGYYDIWPERALIVWGE
jgi:hypothetical protein